MRMPGLNSYFLIILLIFNTAAMISCKKKSDVIAKPATTTTKASYIGRHWAVLNGVVNPNNSVVSISFDLGTTKDFTQNFPGVPSTLSGKTATLIYASVTGLKASTGYFYRLKVTSSTGIFTGVDTSFTTSDTLTTPITFNPGIIYGTLNDIDENVYKTITIGTQTWMAENLKTTRYNNGESVTYIPGNEIWADSTFAGYCWYNSDSVGYGALYNWAAVTRGNLCPAGWHIPADYEWSSLTAYLGGDTSVAGKLMETGKVHWEATTFNITNETGFTALPAGYRNLKGIYGNIRRAGYWWSSTEYSSLNAFCRTIYYSFNDFTRTNSSKKSGFSIRCLKD